MSESPISSYADAQTYACQFCKGVSSSNRVAKIQITCTHNSQGINLLDLKHKSVTLSTGGCSLSIMSHSVYFRYA